VLSYALVPLLAFAALAMWALSSPVGSSPDEDYHLASVWCGGGLEDGTCEEGAQADEREVPASVAQAAGCFAFHPETSAHCQAGLLYEDAPRLVNTDRGNFTGGYPPVFYATMSLFVGDDVSRSVLAMRLVNAALFVGLLTAVFWLLPRSRRTMLTFGTTVALVPLGVFIVPSVNPSSWAVTSCAVVFPALVGYFESSGRRRLALGALAALATLMGAGARADAAVYIAFAAVLAVVVSAPWRRDLWKLLILPAVLCLGCAVSYLTSGQSEAASQGLAGSVDQHAGLLAEIGYNVLNVPTLWAGALGSWGLGWLDTTMPSIVWVANLATFGAVLYVGMRQASRRKVVAFVLTLAAVWAIPTVVLVQSNTVVGQQVQPRYLLPLLILLAQVALFRVGPERQQFTRSQLVTAGAVLAVTNAVALHFELRRYVTGDDVFGPNLDRGREWWWALPVTPMGVWLIGAVAFAAAAILCARAVTAPVADGGPIDAPEDGGGRWQDDEAADDDDLGGGVPDSEGHAPVRRSVPALA
jgi:hypothetical protein